LAYRWLLATYGASSWTLTVAGYLVTAPQPGATTFACRRWVVRGSSTAPHGRLKLALSIREI
jgi:hypothetical protein